MKNNLIFLFAVFFSFATFAQKDPIKWKTLTPEEIDLKVYNNDPNIPAVVLYDIGKMYFDINYNGKNLFLFRERHVRIKILNEDGLKYAKVKFFYHDMNCEQYYGESSYELKAITHNIDKNGKISSVKFKNKNIEISDSTDCIKIAEFELPEVHIGSILEFIITTPTLKLIHPDSWQFQADIPVIYSEFRARIPQNFNYLFSVKNINELPIQDSTYYDKVLNYRYTVQNRTYTSIINLSGKEYRFVNQFMPSLKNPDDAEKINIHLKRIKSEPENYAWKRLTKALMITTWHDYDRRTPGQRQVLNYPASYIIYYLPSWSDLNEQLLFDDQFGLALIKHWDCDSLILSETLNALSERQKAEAIYHFVKSNMKWNREYNLYADVSDGLFKKLYGKIDPSVKLNNIGLYFEEGEGTSSEINFVLMHLLKKEGFNVYPVLVNTKENEPVDKEISDIKQFVTTVALLEIGDDQILLDAAETESQFDKISEKYDKEQMFVIRKESFGWLFQNN